MLRPFAEATLIFTEPASTPMSPVSASPLAKMTPPTRYPALLHVGGKTLDYRRGKRTK